MAGYLDNFFMTKEDEAPEEVVSPEAGPLAALERVAAPLKDAYTPYVKMPELEQEYERQRDRGISPERAQQSIEKTFALGQANKAQPAIQPVPTVGTPVQKTEGTPSAAVAKMTEGAGGDEPDLRSMFLSQVLARSAAGLGDLVSGKKTDIGVADMLGERYKQAQALQAKRAEKGEEQKLFGAGNRAALQAAVSRFADKPEVRDALLQLDRAVDMLAPRDFQKALLTAIESPGKVAVSDARAADIGAATGVKQTQTQLNLDKSGRVQTLTPLEAEQKKAQTAKIYADIDRQANEFKLKERDAEAAPGKTEQEQAVKLNDLAEKEKGFGGYVTLANDLADLEAAAPGLVTQGKPPEWLTSVAQAEGQNWPRSADSRVVRFMAAYGKLASAERHRLYGSAQTEGELKSFLQMLNDNPISGGPDVLATQMAQFGGNVAKKATSTLSRYNNVFSPKTVDRVLGGEFKPLYAEGGVFAGLGQKSPFVVAAPSAATITIKRKTDGKTKTVPAADKAKWLANPDFEEVK